MMPLGLVDERIYSFHHVQLLLEKTNATLSVSYLQKVHVQL